MLPHHFLFDDYLACAFIKRKKNKHKHVLAVAEIVDS